MSFFPPLPAARSVMATTPVVLRGSVLVPLSVFLWLRSRVLVVVARRRRVGTLNVPLVVEEEARAGSWKARRDEDVDGLVVVAIEADSARLSERRSMMVVVG